MKFDGRALADTILEVLKGNVLHLKEEGISPTLGVILVGDNPASLAYIKQKQKAAQLIGANVILKQFPETTRVEAINETIDQWNNDSTIHGLIVQRPLPTSLANSSTSLHSAIPGKDVDGFVDGSPFDVPVAKAVLLIVKQIYSQLTIHNSLNLDAVHMPAEFTAWLLKQKIIVIGRGETAGKPIAELLERRSHTIHVVHSQTTNPDHIIKTGDIVISCVGKENVVRRDTIKQGAILISVGIWRDSLGKLHGDYEETDIEGIASWYTPTPGGVGPVNVACLMDNLVKAAQNTSK